MIFIKYVKFQDKYGDVLMAGPAQTPDRHALKGGMIGSYAA
jgi:hypothetical protein